MIYRLFKYATLAALLAAASLTGQANAAAMTAGEFFRDGNRLFRDDLYWAALLRYRQARQEGMDTPLLHYNMGIAHFRARQHIRARDELTEALSDPSLKVAAHYNLGLNAYQLGEIDEALRWFRLARDQNRSEKIREYAIVAIARIRDGRANPLVDPVERKEKKRELTKLELYASVGAGVDDNVYRTPEQSYIDLADPTTPVVVPVAKTGTYLPVRIGAKYFVNSLKYEGFYVSYRLSGRYYQETDLDNANEFQHEAKFGNAYRRKEGSRERRVHSAFSVAQHEETYYDRDDGEVRDINGVPAEDRLDYLRYGPEISFRQSHERLAFGVRLKGQLWNYAEQQDISEYDHEYMFVGLFGQIKPADTSLFRVEAEAYSRRFGDRPSFDLDGQQRLGNPDIRYDYLSLGMTARQRVTDGFWFGFKLSRTERRDQHVGYNDYTRDSFGLEFNWSIGDRFRISGEGSFSSYDYPNAFAFHNPAAPIKTQERTLGKLEASFRLTRHLTLFGEGRYQNTDSNDIRIDYARNQVSLGVRWEQ